MPAIEREQAVTAAFAHVAGQAHELSRQVRLVLKENSSDAFKICVHTRGTRVFSKGLLKSNIVDSGD